MYLDVSVYVSMYVYVYVHVYVYVYVYAFVYVYVYVYVYWRLGGETNREIVSFRSCVRAGEARRSCVSEREAMSHR